MPQPMLILMGPRGSGKSLLAKMLGESLARPWIDLDDRTASAAGFRSTAEALRALGEPGFRKAECDALRAVLNAPSSRGLVLALGGGTPTHAPSLALLESARQRARAAVVYLEASAGTLRSRLSATDVSSRPALIGADPLSEIEQVLLTRDPIYRQLADFVLSTDTLGPQEAVERVTSWAGRARAS